MLCSASAAGACTGNIAVDVCLTMSDEIAVQGKYVPTVRSHEPTTLTIESIQLQPRFQCIATLQCDWRKSLKIMGFRQVTLQSCIALKIGLSWTKAAAQHLVSATHMSADMMQALLGKYTSA